MPTSGSARERRLMAMEFHPSDDGGFWWPAGVPVTAEGQTGWVDAWEDGITEEEADWAAFEMASTKPHGPDRAALIRKLRSLSQSTPEGEG